MFKYLVLSAEEDLQFRWIALISVLLLGYSATRVIYLLFFHPLAVFPGPRTAALSTWWIYRISKTGQAEQVFERLHRKYNTQALRIGPNELHVTDPQHYHTIYSQRQIFTKDTYFYAGFNIPHTLFQESNPELHRQRRRKMNAFFAKSSIRDLQGIMMKQISCFCDKISREKSKGPIQLYQEFRCLTVDIISELALGKSFDTLGDAKKDNFREDILQTFNLAVKSIWISMYIPVVRALANSAPPSIAAALSPAAAHLQGLLAASKSTIVQFKKHQASGKMQEHEVVFDKLTGFTDTELQFEAAEILIAGSDTTAITLSSALEQIARHPVIYAKLKQELSTAGLGTTDAYDLLRLEQLPYLSAVMKESLRYGMPVPGRLPRIVPPGIEPIIIDGKEIPAGTTIGMSAYSVHFNEEIWGTDAREFRPERWLTDDAKHLEKSMVSFSKGARQCIGINLAQAEMILTLAMLVNRFSFTIDETMAEDDTFPLDYFVLSFRGSGIRLHVHET